MGRLKVGVGVSVITPPVGKPIPVWRYRRGRAVGVHDDLLVKAVVLSDESTTIALATLDVALIDEATIQGVREKVSRLTGIPGENVMFNCSHNHTSPTPPSRDTARGKIIEKTWPSLNFNEYMSFQDYVAGAIVEAYHNMERAEIGADKGDAPGVTVNRRHPEELVDTELGVIKICREDGSLLSSLVNFQCHALAVGGQYLLWTADFPGFMRDFVESAYPLSSCLFLQGAAGDIHPWDWWFGNMEPKHPATFEEAEKLGRILGSEACKVLEGIDTSKDVEIKVASKRILLEGRRFPWSKEEAEEVIEEVLRKDKPWRKAVWPKGVTIADIYHRYPSGYRYGLIPFIRYIAELAEKGEAMPNVEAEIQAFKINDIVLILTPGELFNQLGRRIKEGSPYKNTFVLSETTAVGYIPPREAYEEVSGMSLREVIDPEMGWWAYGATYTCYVAPGTGEKIVEESLSLIEEL